VKRSTGKKKLPIGQGAIWQLVLHSIERKGVISRVLNANCTKGENGLNELRVKPKFLKVFIKG